MSHLNANYLRWTPLKFYVCLGYVPGLFGGEFFELGSVVCCWKVASELFAELSGEFNDYDILTDFSSILKPCHKELMWCYTNGNSERTSGESILSEMKLCDSITDSRRRPVLFFTRGTVWSTQSFASFRRRNPLKLSGNYVYHLIVMWATGWREYLDVRESKELQKVAWHHVNNGWDFSPYPRLNVLSPLQTSVN
jgi:hypothetical protein